MDPIMLVLAVFAVVYALSPVARRFAAAKHEIAPEPSTSPSEACS